MDYVADGAGFWFFVLIALAAALYSCVGQGGGSGYLAVMALFSVSPMSMKPAALVMNIFVTSVVWYRYQRQGQFHWPLFWPFALASIPAAFVGGALTLEAAVYRLIVAVALVVAALRLVWGPIDESHVNRPQLPVALFIGAVLGLLSGATGVGGGIFLAPLLLLFRWSTLRETFALSAAFIWVNSVAAVAGYTVAVSDWPPQLAWMVLAALAGTAVGMALSKRHAAQTLQRILGLVLLVAATKLLFDL